MKSTNLHPFLDFSRNPLIVRLSFEIPSERFEEVRGRRELRHVPDNFQKVNLGTRRFLEKVLPKGQLITNVTSPEVTRVK